MGIASLPMSAAKFQPRAPSHDLGARGLEPVTSMASQSKKTSAEEAVLKRAIAHPRRLEILSYLTRRQGGTETELADELDLPVPQVAYHLKVLQGAELVADAGSPDQGSSDRFLVAVTTPTW